LGKQGQGRVREAGKGKQGGTSSPRTSDTDGKREKSALTANGRRKEGHWGKCRVREIVSTKVRGEGAKRTSFPAIYPVRKEIKRLMLTRGKIGVRDAQTILIR